MELEVTKLRKRSKGTVILVYESGKKINKLNAIVQDKMNDNFNVTELIQRKLKIKISGRQSQRHNIADKLNVFFVDSINKIMESIVDDTDDSPNRRRI
ncbi:hypothetical protein M0804_000206 [Polistes exclamans]|nr:hypothetical protein M0804_000206 [Polistes exclamans]